VRFAVWTEKGAPSSHEYFRYRHFSTLKLKEIQKYGKYRSWFDSKEDTWQRCLHVSLHSLSFILPINNDTVL